MAREKIAFAAEFNKIFNSATWITVQELESAAPSEDLRRVVKMRDALLDFEISSRKMPHTAIPKAIKDYVRTLPRPERKQTAHQLGRAFRLASAMDALQNGPYEAVTYDAYFASAAGFVMNMSFLEKAALSMPFARHFMRLGPAVNVASAVRAFQAGAVPANTGLAIISYAEKLAPEVRDDAKKTLLRAHRVAQAFACKI